MQYASGVANFKIVSKILESSKLGKCELKKKINEYNIGGLTALHSACSKKNEKVVDLLLKNGASKVEISLEYINIIILKEFISCCFFCFVFPL